MNKIMLLLVALAAILQGCATGTPTGRKVTFDVPDRFEFSFVQNGCVATQGKFTNRTERGYTRPTVSFVAVNRSGHTVGEFIAWCKTVAAHGSSDCEITSPTITVGKTFSGCAEYEEFRVVR